MDAMACNHVKKRILDNGEDHEKELKITLFCTQARYEREIREIRNINNNINRSGKERYCLRMQGSKGGKVVKE